MSQADLSTLLIHRSWIDDQLKSRQQVVHLDAEFSNEIEKTQ